MPGRRPEGGRLEVRIPHQPARPRHAPAAPELVWNAGSAASARPPTRCSRPRAPKSCRKGKADLWDSGKVESSESVHVVYGGQPLRCGPAGLLESARLGPGRQALGLQRGGVVGDGLAGAGGLARGLDHAPAARRRSQSSRCSRTTRRRCSGRSLRSRRSSAAPGSMSAGWATTSCA